MASPAEVLLEIRRLARDELKLTRELRAEDRLVEDLQLDSMTLTALAVALEDHFQVILTDADPARVARLGDLASYVAERSISTPGIGG